jgi:hypothetical protein
VVCARACAYVVVAWQHGMTRTLARASDQAYHSLFDAISRASNALQRCSALHKRYALRTSQQAAEALLDDSEALRRESKLFFDRMSKRLGVSGARDLGRLLRMPRMANLVKSLDAE